MTARALVSRFWPLLLIAFSGIAGGVGIHQWKERLRTEGQNELLRASADSAKALSDSVLRSKAEADSLHALKIAEADSAAEAEARARAEARQRAADAQRRADEAMDAAERAVEGNAEAEAAVADVRQALESERTEWRATERTYMAELVAVRQQRDSWRARYEAADQAVASLRAALAARERVGGTDASRGFFESWGERALFGVGGAVIGALGMALVGG